MEILTLAEGERAASLRRQLIVLQHTKAIRKQRRAIHQYDGHAASATHAFFRRISTRFSKPRVIGAMDPAREGLMTASQLAMDWTPIIQQPPMSLQAAETFFCRLTGQATQLRMDEAFDAFTEAEVLAAIAACPAGKASGPDGIPNDWYKEMSPTLAPILAKLFSKWAEANTQPRSFAEATIFCLPKVQSSRNGLDYRPIALLNTDDKIYSRLLLQRVQQHVATVVSPAQFGFVAARQVHDAIDVWDAMQALVAAGELPDTATAVMLDFAKAYDTLDRTFLRRALEFHGLSAHLVAAVVAMHLATTARFLADGDLSGIVDIHNGIRQGSSALRARSRSIVQGSRRQPWPSRLRTRSRHKSHNEWLLEDFSQASGLRINVTKSCAVALKASGPTIHHAVMTIPVLGASDMLRHLSMAIASSPSSTAIWSRTLQQVRATLHIAHVKTTNLLQRVEICTAIVMPKLLFVGRHAWPTSSIFDRLQRFVHPYAWHGTLAEVSPGKRAWMSKQVATLPVALGGIGLPDVRAAFVKMSAAVVARWSNTANSVSVAAGKVLHRLRSGGPAGRFTGSCRQEQPPVKIAKTLAATRLAAQRFSHVLVRDDDERAALEHLLPVTGRGGIATRWWADGWYHCDFTAKAPELSTLRDAQSHLYGAFNIAARMAAPLLGAGVLHVLPSVALSSGDILGLSSPGARIGDVIQLERVGRSNLRFRSRQYEWPLPQRVVQGFRLLCDVVVHNYPAVLLPQNKLDELRPRPPAHVIWRLRCHGNTKELLREPVARRTEVLGRSPHAS